MKINIELFKGKNDDDQDNARQEIFKYIELYYNTKTLHSSLVYISPRDYKGEFNRKIITKCPL